MEELERVPTWTITLGDKTYLILEWDGALNIVENSRGIEIDFSLPQVAYDPRKGGNEELLPTRDYYTADLWINEWIQEQWRRGVPFEVKVEGVDWSDVLAPIDPDVLY